MANKSSENKRAVAGSFTVKEKIIKRNGKEYLYYSARVTVGYDPGTGKQIQRTFTGKSKKEVSDAARKAAVEISEGVYKHPSKMSLSAWMDIWAEEYLGAVKPRTVDSYKATIRTHIKPALGAVKLSALSPHDIQRFYNSLQKGEKALSPKTVKNTHGVLHKALQQAVKVGYLKSNPADACELPRVERKEMNYFHDEDIAQFIEVIKGHQYEFIYLTTLFTGMREGEVLGLTWDCVDFEAGTITIKQQLQRIRGEGVYKLVSPKNSKSRIIMPAHTVMVILKKQRVRQMEWQLKSYGAWENPLNLVFTNELGHNLSAQTVYLHFKKLAGSIGKPEVRFHDLRHTYAVSAIEAGIDMKTISANLGHYSLAFTFDQYGHVSPKMHKQSSSQMEQFINDIKALKEA